MNGTKEAGGRRRYGPIAGPRRWQRQEWSCSPQKGPGRPGRRLTATVLVAVFVLVLVLATAGGGTRAVAAAGSGAPGTPAGEAAGPPGGEAPTASGAPPGPVGRAPWEQVTVVVHPDPAGRGMAVLMLARWRGEVDGQGDAAGALPLPNLQPATPSEPLPQGLRWTGGALEDTAPPAPGEAKDYAYAFVADTRATQGRLHIVLPAAVEQLVVMTVEGELVARGDGLQPAGTVAGAQLGMPGTDLAVWTAGPLAKGTYTVLLMPPGMVPPGDGGAGRGDAGPGAGGGTAPAGAGSTATSGSATGWAGGGALVVATALAALGAAGAVRWWHSPARWQRRRRLLIEAIVELDRAHAAGGVPEAIYREERRRLVEAAVAATRRWWAARRLHSPAGQEPPDTGPSGMEATPG